MEVSKQFSLAFKSNLTNSVSPKTIGSDVVGGLIAAAAYVIPGTFLQPAFQLSGWSTMAISFLCAWIPGAVFNIPSARGAAFALPFVHLMHAEFRNQIEEVTGKPLWRYTSATAATTTPTTTGATQQDGLLRGLSSPVYSEPVQSGAQIMRIPDGTGGSREVVSYGGTTGNNMAPNRGLLPGVSGVRLDTGVSGLSACQGGSMPNTLMGFDSDVSTTIAYSL